MAGALLARGHTHSGGHRRAVVANRASYPRAAGVERVPTPWLEFTSGPLFLYLLYSCSFKTSLICFCFAHPNNETILSDSGDRCHQETQRDKKDPLRGLLRL